MRRLNGIQARTGIAILAFSLIITILFSGILFLFRNTAQNNVNTNTYTYEMTDDELRSAIIDTNGIYIQQGRLIRTAEYQSKQLFQTFSSFLPYAAAFCVLLFASSLVFWTILKRLFDKQTIILTDNLDYLEDSSDTMIDNQMLAAAYEKLKKRFSERLDDSKRLYAYLSHEQKNTLAILRTNLELNNYAASHRELDELADSIDDVLTLAESSDSSTMGIVDVALVCAEVCDKYNKITESTDMIVFEFDENEDTEIWAKMRWVYRSISNLVSNAIKYGEGKPITVTVKNKHRSVIVTVKDQGIGIPYDKQEKIFNHSYRVNDLNKDGYGIGLSLVSHVCALCGGFAFVESQPGKGSAFYLSFPAV